LRTLLEPEGFVLEVVSDEAALLSAGSEWRPSLLLLDYELAGSATRRLCRDLYSEALPWNVPLVVSSAGPLEESCKAEVFEGGAWLVLTEPLFFSSLLAQLRKLAEVSFVAESPALRTDPAAGELPALEESWRAFGILASLAERRGAALTCVVAGPTTPAGREMLSRQRRATAEMCARSLRSSDVYAWAGSDGGDVVILAYGASPEGAEAMVRRLNRAASDRAELAETSDVLSAGIREILPAGSEGRPTAGHAAADRIRSDGLASARTALRLARQAGGGVRIAGSS
jgi:DNA-binding response OmpR family regulator